jgi:hypothetical protein
MAAAEQIDPYYQAAKAADDGHAQEATTALLKLLDANFDDLNAIDALGYVLIKVEKWGLAYVLLKYCTMRDPETASKRSAIWQNLAKCCHSVLRDEEAEDYFKAAIAADPKYMNGLDGLSLINLMNAHYGLSIEYADRALAIDPECIDPHVNRAMSLLALRKWKEGWPGFNKNVGKHKDRTEMKYADEPRWDGSKGKDLVVYGEQGLGDEICFSSCLPDLIADSGRVTIECDPRLKAVFKRSFPACTVHGTRYLKGRDKNPPDWDHKFDARVAMGELPGYYRNSDESFPRTPYLVPDEAMRAMWRAYFDQLGPRLKVGIAWNGGRFHTYQNKRSLSLEQLKPILELPCDWVSLEYLPRDKEIAQFKNETGITIHHWPHVSQAFDYDLTIAALAELDLVISVTTAVVDACGAIGKECWCMVPRHPLWKHLESGTEYPWAKSVSLFRQKGDIWPIAKIREKLEARLELKKVA